MNEVARLYRDLKRYDTLLARTRDEAVIAAIEELILAARARLDELQPEERMAERGAARP